MKTTGIQLTDNANALQGVDLLINTSRGADGLIMSGITVANTMNQNQALILIANPGEFKKNPTIGVAIDELLLDNDFLRFRHRIRVHFERDGLVVRNVQLEEGKPLLIDASYE
jgi:predicted proteasome-type protease